MQEAAVFCMKSIFDLYCELIYIYYKYYLFYKLLYK